MNSRGRRNAVGQRPLPRRLAAQAAAVLGLLMGVMLVAASMFGAAQQTSASVSVEDTSRAYPVDGKFAGKADAPVKVVIYSDPQCSHCLDLHERIEGRIIEDYVVTGKVQLEVRLLAVLGPDSDRAVEATACAAEQNRFWDYREALYAGYKQVAKTAYSRPELQSTAQRLGLDVGRWSQCQASGAGRERIAADKQASTADGISGVPATFINGVLIKGAQPYEQFSTIIDQELAK